MKLPKLHPRSFLAPAAAWLTATAAALLGPGVIGSGSAAAQLNVTPREMQGIGVDERLGNQAAIDLEFYNARGKPVKLREWFTEGKPAILVLAYYDCPVVCPVIFNKLQECFNDLDYTIGEDFNVLVVSFDPTNSTEMAAGKKAAYLAGYDRDGRDAPWDVIERGWEFFTASAENVRMLADSVGFHYKYLVESGEYSHPVAFMVLTPEGKVARYVYGFNYPPLRMRLALLEASEGQIAESVLDRILMFCFHYDPSRGAYTMQAMAVMQIGSFISMFGVFGLIGYLKFTDSRRTRRLRDALEVSMTLPNRPHVS